MTLSTCLFAILQSVVASAASPSIRAIDGSIVALDPDTVVVAWKLDDPQSLAALAAAELARETLGVRVVAANLDGANSQSRLSPYLRSHGIHLDAVVRAEGSNLQVLQTSSVGLMVLGQHGKVAHRLNMSEDANLTLLRIADATQTIAGVPGAALAQVER
jgi:hypothetical protein